MMTNKHLINIGLFRTVNFNNKIYLINHVSAETLITRRIIPPGTNILPAEVQTQ